VSDGGCLSEPKLKRVCRLARKARINVQDRWAEAFEQTYATLKDHASRSTDFDLELKASHRIIRLSTPLSTSFSFRHSPIICSSWSVSIHFICSLLINGQLELSSPPAPSTLAHAEIILTMEKSALEDRPELTWKRIMEEEPFEGEHWEDIGISSRRRSTPSSGSESDSDDTRSRSEDSRVTTVSHESSSGHRNTVTPLTPPINKALRNRMIVEELQNNQCWRADWRGDMTLDAPFRLADPASFGPTSWRTSLVSTSMDPSPVSSPVFGSTIPDSLVALH
jgi:gamma-tubulin complex component 5